MIPLNVEQKFLDKVDELADETLRLLQDLVKIRSIMGEENDVQRFCHKTFTSMGLETDSWYPDVKELQKNPDFFETISYKRVGHDNRPVIVAKLRGTGGGRSLIVNGHIDTVSHEPADEWTHDPFGGEVEGARLYGRGSCDMKSGVAAMIMIVKCIQELDLKPKGDILLNTVPDEEDGGVGRTLATIVRGYTADGVIITEPSGTDKIVVANGGVRYFRTRIPGRTSHAALAHKGVNAIGKAMNIYHALVELNEHRQRTIRNPIFEYPGR